MFDDIVKKDNEKEETTVDGDECGDSDDEDVVVEETGDIPSDMIQKGGLASIQNDGQVSKRKAAPKMANVWGEPTVAADNKKSSNDEEYDSGESEAEGNDEEGSSSIVYDLTGETEEVITTTKKSSKAKKNYRCRTPKCKGTLQTKSIRLCETCRRNIQNFIPFHTVVPTKKEDNMANIGSGVSSGPMIDLPPEWADWEHGLKNGAFDRDQTEMIISVFVTVIVISKITDSPITHFGLSFEKGTLGACEMNTITVNVAHYLETMRRNEIGFGDYHKFLHFTKAKRLSQQATLLSTILHEFAHLRAGTNNGHNQTWANVMQALTSSVYNFRAIQRSRMTSSSGEGPSYLETIIRRKRSEFVRKLRGKGFIWPEEKTSTKRKKSGSFSTKKKRKTQ